MSKREEAGRIKYEEDMVARQKVMEELSAQAEEE